MTTALNIEQTTSGWRFPTSGVFKGTQITEQMLANRRQSCSVLDLAILRIRDEEHVEHLIEVRGDLCLHDAQFEFVQRARDRVQQARTVVSEDIDDRVPIRRPLRLSLERAHR